MHLLDSALQYQHEPTESEAVATAPDSAEGDSGSDEDGDDITERFKIELRKLFWRYLMYRSSPSCNTFYFQRPYEV